MNDKYTKKRLQKTVVSKWQLKRRQRSEAQLQRAAAAAYISIRKFRKQLELKLFFFFSPAAFLRTLFFDTREISDFLLFSPPTPPYTLGFSAGKLPAWPQRRYICCCTAISVWHCFCSPLQGSRPSVSRECPYPHMPLPHPDPPPLAGDHLLISSSALASPPASFS